jgi:Zn-dependent protease
MESPLTDLSRGDVLRAVLFTLAFVVAIVAHEGNHALTATFLGDDTPRRAGRLSLNPMRHIDRLGLLMFVLAGFGWASTPVNPNKLRPNPRLGNAIVAAAGPAANLLLAVIFAILIRERLLVGSPPLIEFVVLAMTLNLLLFVFNLIPLPPLDGFRVLLGLVPRQIAFQLRRYEQYGPGLLLVLILILPMFHINVLAQLFGQVARIFRLWTGLV